MLIFCDFGQQIGFGDFVEAGGQLFGGELAFLLGEFFYHDNQKEKAKEFFNKIISLENSNQNIKIEAQKRINRDFSD